ncbi:hypothetical protein SKAU_G00234150 [Synaphobranchus kaupii]|uniref:CCHC-type domain-containing protein n=1 Tax=Synaphobranchus kaupii TaxID=118154 RepID=A0A9Q1ITK0_SYNKA|nr:hypothetical protein SKAU_G00234150 [Synaphobranchus kaupii]
MATVGSLSEFVESDGDWIEYVERLEHFFLANDIADEAKKRSILLSVCGARTYKLIRNLAMPQKPGEIGFRDLVTMVQNHHNPKPSVIVQRFKFHTYSRKPGVSVAAFVAELRQLSEYCEFGAVLYDMLCDRLVCGINDDGLQRRLLGEATLTFKKALEISQAMETAANNTKDIQKANGGAQPSAVHHVSTEKTGKSVECYRCGGAHFANDCGFKDAVCHNCQKKGHIAKKCRGAKNKQKKEWGKSKPKMSTHHLQGEEPEEPCSFNMFNLREPRAEPIHATLQINGKDLKMEVGTGASVSVISQDTYSKLWCSGGAPALKGTHIRLKTYTDELGTLRGTTVKLCVDPKVQPRFFKPHSVPYAMKAKVKAELERLQQLDVIEPMEFSDWAAPIVPVLKDDGNVRICGDYKLTVNQASQLDTYPLP